MNGKIPVGASERRALAMILLLSSTLFILFVSAVPAHSQTNSPPVFSATTYSFYSSESPAPFRPVGIPVVAADPDPGDKLTYSLEGEDSIFFSVGQSSGQLETTQPLDYEIRPAYLVKVKATDTGGRYDTAYVIINVTNIDEEGVVSLTPITSSNGPGALATLTDPDNSLSEVSWQWATSYDQTTWTSVTGAESPSFVPREEDLRRFLRVSVGYTDGHGPGKVAATLLYENIFGGNHAPEFPFSESGVRSTSTTTSLGAAVGQPMLASDLDGDLITYLLTGEASTFFAIDPHSGQLETKISLDKNFTGRYFGEVHVFDGRGGTTAKEIRVDVGAIPVHADTLVEDNGTNTTTPLDEEEETDGTKADSPAHLSTQPQPKTVLQESDTGVAIPTKQQTDPAQPARGDIEEGTPRTQEPDESPVIEQPNSEEQEQELPIAVLMESPPLTPIVRDEATGVVSVERSTQDAAAEGGASWRWLGWAIWYVVCALLIAVVVLILLKLRQNNRREVELPPPTFGPERRILS